MRCNAEQNQRNIQKLPERAPSYIELSAEAGDEIAVALNPYPEEEKMAVKKSKKPTAKKSIKSKKGSTWPRMKASASQSPPSQMPPDNIPGTPQPPMILQDGDPAHAPGHRKIQMAAKDRISNENRTRITRTNKSRHINSRR